MQNNRGVRIGRASLSISSTGFNFASCEKRFVTIFGCFESCQKINNEEIPIHQISRVFL